jgi:beta-phosphoglucomutase-like phosphatase (HAD superfamily)
MTTLQIAPQVKALIFDIDGTLADTMPTHFAAWQQTALKYGFEFSEALFYEWAGIPTLKIAHLLNEKFGYQFSPELIAKEKEENYLLLAKTVKPILPVVAIAKANYGKMPMSCGTGNFKSVAIDTLKGIGILDLFEGIISADDVAAPKPDPETFLKCAALMGVEPQYCQVFEDGEQGLTAARAAGMVATDIRLYI